jgi:hypothetical protein
VRLIHYAFTKTIKQAANRSSGRRKEEGSVIAGVPASANDLQSYEEMVSFGFEPNW